MLLWKYNTALREKQGDNGNWTNPVFCKIPLSTEGGSAYGRNPPLIKGEMAGPPKRRGKLGMPDFCMGNL